MKNEILVKITNEFLTCTLTFEQLSLLLETERERQELRFLLEKALRMKGEVNRE